MTHNRLLRSVYNTIVLLLLIGGAWLVLDNFVHFGRVEFTDNATVQQHITPVNTRVQGFIKEIRFEEFQPVHKGDTLVIIEDAEYRLRLAQAEADLEGVQSGRQATSQGIHTTQTTMHVTDASVEEARVQLDNARREDQRYAQLLQGDAVTPQQYDHVHTAFLAAQARYEQLSRQLQTLASTRTEQSHRLNQHTASIEVARAAVDLARLNLSYTVIVATADGVTGRKDIHVGQLVNPGQTMVDIVDNTDLWIVANYRETQLQHIAPGSKVRVTVDAVPGVEFSGEVERISDATGSAFSVIPQDNATGNFVKVEQRVPVRIRLKGDGQPDKLRAGMNVECEVKY